MKSRRLEEIGGQLCVDVPGHRTNRPAAKEAVAVDSAVVGPAPEAAVVPSGAEVVKIAGNPDVLRP